MHIPLGCLFSHLKTEFPKLRLECVNVLLIYKEQCLVFREKKRHSVSATQAQQGKQPLGQAKTLKDARLKEF